MVGWDLKGLTNMRIGGMGFRGTELGGTGW